MGKTAALQPVIEGRRALGFWMCLALVVGNLIGSGIFMLPAALAPYGWNASFGWLLTIAGSLCVAFVFSRLTRAFPLVGGPYAVVLEAFGPLPAFLVAWSYWIAIWVGVAAIAVAAISYASLFVPQLANVPGVGAVAAVGLLWLLTAVNCASVRAAGTVQLVTAVLKLLPLAVVIAIAAWLLASGEAPVHTPLRMADLGISGMSAAAAIALWAMLGVESAAVGAGKVREPDRTVPRATMLGTLLVGVVYLLVSTPVALFLPAEAVADSNAPIADFVAAFWGPAPAAAVGLFAIVSAAGALNGWVLLQGEMPMAMARQGVFPRWFGKTSENGVAVRAQILSSGLATMLIASNYSRSVAALFLFMILLSTAATLVLYFVCALSALKLQREGRLPFSGLLTAVALLGALYSVWTLFGAGGEAVLWGAVLLASGLPLHFLMRRGRSNRPAVDDPAPLRE